MEGRRERGREGGREGEREGGRIVRGEKGREGEEAMAHVGERSSVTNLLSKSTKKSILGTDPLSFNTRSRFPMATACYLAT